MNLRPAAPVTPAYPGSAPRRTLFTSFRLMMSAKITLSGCLCFLLQCSVVFTALPASAQSSSPSSSSQASPRQSDVECLGKIAPTPPPPPPCAGAPVANPHFSDPPPCTGSVVALPDDPPPPCRGIVAPEPPPPPCNGDYSPPRRPEPIPPQPILPREVTLEEINFHARDYLGMKVRVEGKLGRMPSEKLVDRGFFLFREAPVATPKGELFACPITGDCSEVREGDRVVVEGTVTRREGGPGEGKEPQTYFVISIDRISRR